jgi:urease subunit alpha
MKRWRASETGRGHAGLPDDPAGDDNERVLRYLAKVTVEPAITHGISDFVGSLRTGRLADVVLWKPGYFGVKPYLVIKSGHPAWAPLGEGNASVRSSEPTRYGPDWAGLAQGAPSVAVTFVSSSADAERLRRRIDSTRAFVAVAGCRGLTRDALSRNRSTAPIEVDPIDGRVTLAGRSLACEPLADVPLSRRYFLR